VFIDKPLDLGVQSVMVPSKDCDQNFRLTSTSQCRSPSDHEHPLTWKLRPVRWLTCLWYTADGTTYLPANSTAPGLDPGSKSLARHYQPNVVRSMSVSRAIRLGLAPL